MMLEMIVPDARKCKSVHIKTAAVLLGAAAYKKAGERIRTADVQLGKLTFCH